MSSGFFRTTTYLLSILTILFLSACAPTSRYHQAKDSIPTRTPTLSEQKNAVPRLEKQSRGGNKHYTVRGKYYEVLPTANHYKEIGIASFYGEKFHGHLTSNGEIYNMYSMSAAHKSLPLPSYVKVTNLDNKKVAIVRVNDRGPFHPGRIIDLSYSAAYKLGISGVANVAVEAITDFNSKKISPINNTNVITNPIAKETTQTISTDTKSSAFNEQGTHSPPSKVIQTPDKNVNKNVNKKSYIQVFVTSKSDIAKEIISSLSLQYQQPVQAYEQSGLHRVVMGPFDNKGERFLFLQRLRSSGYKGAFNKELRLP